MNSNGDEDYDMPLLVRSNSLSPRSHSSFGGSNKSPKSNGSYEMDTNIAAVSDDFESLAFPDTKRVDTDRTSNSSSPLSIPEDNPFVAQFDPEVIRIIDEKDDSAVATVFDDNTSNDESLYNDDDDEEHEVNSLRPPSINAEDEEKNGSAKSDDNVVDKTSTASRKSGLSSSTTPEKKVDEDADAAAWKADEIDDFVNAIGFGQPTMEISGVDLLTERDSSVNELQEINHLMTFNALVLIQKQKDWIEGSNDTTKGANKGATSLIAMELENLERKIKLLMDNKSWPNEKERKRQEANPFTPSKAFFKSMALVDKSIQQFHDGYLKYMARTSQENHELKTRIEKLVEVNASLQEQARRSIQKTETIRKLQKEREDLTQTVDFTDQILSSLLVNAGRENRELPKIHGVKAYVQKLETQRNSLQTEIQSLKGTGSNVDSDEDNNDVAKDELSTGIIEEDEALEDSSPNVPVETDTNEAGILDTDLGSKWNSLEQNELEMTSKDEKIKALTETVAGQESALASVRAECKLMKTQLLQLEKTRNEFKAQCKSKDSALLVSQDRISSLEIEVLEAHAQCATYEEDYEAMRESFATQEVATKQEINNSQDGVKIQVEQVREEFEEKLKESEAEMKDVIEDRDRVIRDLKASVDEVEKERDNLKTLLGGKTIIPVFPQHTDAVVEEEKKEEMYETGPSVVSPTSEPEFDLMRSRFAEKASKQAFTIAQLSEENEMKDEQLKSLQEMVEMLLGKRNSDFELQEEGGKRQWGKRISQLRAMSQQSASNIINRSRHGSQHGSMHGE
eukprot:CAMPEP_0116133456 /NCGR_PEP_ID=MMETSP0329-20121206/10115_1 /TAXON_ID=697910 /ORGANISM="Pseudo-nitzschia arenysensis, Strain B593" /LENGTH=794 /DNA_ID=CAMNT_0003628087 /DNA_START=239 /DNA_END=2623 /DNA_ORIENTATION=-